MTQCALLRKFATALLTSEDSGPFKQIIIPLLDTILHFIFVLSRLENNTKRLQLIEIRKSLCVIDEICARIAIENDETLLSEAIELESLKRLADTLPNKTKGIKSLFEYLILEIILKLYQAG